MYCSTESLGLESCQRQSKTSARGKLIHLEETVEDALLQFGSDALAATVNGDDNTFGIPVGIYHYLPLLSKLYRIIYEAFHEARKSLSIRRQSQLVGRMLTYVHADELCRLLRQMVVYGDEILLS